MKVKDIQAVEISDSYYHTKFERDLFRNIWMQATVEVGFFVFVCVFLCYE